MASSNATAKKKQEEKNVKTLREIAALSANKQCFDCLQKGPTYVNTTIGSFVCVSCSGKLRGLTPPHRVKSISMANFTTEEVEFLKSRGNEFCQKVWLGFYDMSHFSSDTKEDQKFKDFLVAKYESKRWYKDPANVARETANQNGFATQKSYPAQAAPSAAPTAVSRPVVHNSPPNLSKPSKGLAELDFFSQPAASQTSSNITSGKASQPSEPFFADFQNAFGTSGNVSLNTKVGSSPMNINTNGQHGKTSSVPSEDRYSALKDLDAIFSSQSPGKQNAEVPGPWSSEKSPWTNGFSSSQSADVPGPWTASKSPWNNGFSSSPVKSEMTQSNTGNNHFGFGNFPEAPTQGVWGSPSASLVHKNGFSSSNPFLNATPVNNNNNGQLFAPAFPAVTPAQAFSPWGISTSPANGGIYGQNGGMTLSSSQSVTFPIKSWPAPVQNPSNPFLDGSGMTAGAAIPKTRSYNPFL